MKVRVQYLTAPVCDIPIIDMFVSLVKNLIVNSIIVTLNKFDFKIEVHDAEGAVLKVPDYANAEDVLGTVDSIVRESLRMLRMLLSKRVIDTLRKNRLKLVYRKGKDRRVLALRHAKPRYEIPIITVLITT